MYHHDQTAPCHRAVFLFVAINLLYFSSIRLRACVENRKQRCLRGCVESRRQGSFFACADNRRQGRLRYRFLVILVSLICSSAVHANVSVNLTVTVQDANSVPLSGVHVFIKELSWGAVSGWDGKLIFDSVPTGTYTLEASHIGYQLSTQHNITIHSGSKVHIIMTLKSESVELPEAEVYAKQNKAITFNRESITILPEYWMRKGARSVGDALSNVPGISILQGDGRQRISLRGSPSHSVEVTLDDIPLSDAGSGIALVDRINLDHIQAIKIDFSGLGGTVRFYTDLQEYNSSDTDVKLTFDSASNAYYSGNIRLENSLRKIQWLGLLSRFSERGDFSYHLDNGNSFRRIGNDANGINGMLKLKFSSPAGNIDGGIYFDDSHHGVPGLIYSSPTPEATLDNRRISLGFHQTRSIGKFKLNSLVFFSNYNDHFQSPAEQYDPISETIVIHYPENNRQQGRRLGLKTAISRDYFGSKGQVSYQVQSDEYSGKDLITDSNTIGGTGLGDAQRTVHNIRLEANIGKSWRGFRYDLISKLSQKYIINRNISNDKFTSPGFTLQAFRSWGKQQLTVHLGWGRSFVSPSFNAVFLENNMFAVGNKNLLPERGENFNLGLQYSLNTAGFGQINGYLNGFSQRTTDLIVWKRNSFNKYFPDNEHEVSQLGIELNLSVNQLKGFISLRGSYIYNRSVIETEGDINQGNIPPLMARNSGTMQVSVDYKKVVSTLSTRWAGRRYSTASNFDPLSTASMGLPPYTIWDAYFLREFKLTSAEITLQVGVDNIFDRNYRLIDRSPMPGREYRFRATFGI